MRDIDLALVEKLRQEARGLDDLIREKQAQLRLVRVDLAMTACPFRQGDILEIRDSHQTIRVWVARVNPSRWGNEDYRLELYKLKKNGAPGLARYGRECLQGCVRDGAVTKIGVVDCLPEGIIAQTESGLDTEGEAAHV